MTNFPYKRIISYGCSLTAGTELLDHAVLNMTENEFVEFLKKNKISSIPEFFSYLKDNFSYDEITSKMFQLNASASWPNFIAKHFSVPHVNQAVPGSSVSHTAYKILKDLASSQIEETDLVLVGITSPSRWFQFLEDGDEAWGVFGIGWNMRFKVEYQKQLEKHWFNAYNIIYSHFKEITFLSDLSDRLGGRIKLCYAFAGPEYLKYFFEEDLQNSRFSDFFNFSVDMCPTHNFLDTTASISNLAGWRKDSTHHVFGHPKIQFHEQFANILIEKMEKMYND